MAPQVQCPHCGKTFKSLGIATHKKSCQKKKVANAQNQKVATELRSDPQCMDLSRIMSAGVRLITTAVVLTRQPVSTFVALQDIDPQPGSSSMGVDSGHHSTCSASIA